LSATPPRLNQRRVFLGVFLLSLCVLMLQLALTRVFSATMYYHFAFLAISLALFGSGAAGVAVYLLGERAELERRPAWLSGSAALAAATTVVALHTVLNRSVSPGDSPTTVLAHLSLIYLSASLPFLFAGAAVALVVRAYAPQMSRLYLYDLGGAATACLLVIPLIDRMGATNAILVTAVLFAVAALVFESARAQSIVALVPTGLLIGLVALLTLNVRTGWLEVRRAKGIDERGHVIFSKWNSFSRVTVWGHLWDPALLVIIDADANTLLWRGGPQPERDRALLRRSNALVHLLRPGARTLILGAGGGQDVLAARLAGASEVTAVEVNPIIARDIASREPFRSYSGALFEQPGVSLVVDEGRSYIRRSRRRWDVIQATMVDTWAATAAGAFALTENNLYTVEAFEDYLARLEPDGLLSFTRWYTVPPDQLLRLLALACTAMAESGIAHPDRHLALVREPDGPEAGRAPATLLVKKSAFTDDEATSVQRLSAHAGLEVLYTPRLRPPGILTSAVENGVTGTEALSGADLSPTRDDRPFFFQTARLSALYRAIAAPAEWQKTNLGTFVLLVLLALTSLLTVACILGPLLLARGRLVADDTPTALGFLGYFACLGAAYIIVEVVLVQKSLLFLGYPVYALAVVLFSLLLFSGIGSAWTGRLDPDRLRRSLTRMLLVVAGLVGLAVAVLSSVFDAGAGLDHPYRIGLTVALLAPLGFTMGMPMPTGIRLLAARRPSLVPWAWGVNGAASVLGSAAALALALTLGFNAALAVGGALYLIALSLVRRAAGRP
jgi:hypothetical protein